MFYTTEQIGPKRAKTPEGFLVCLGTPIARCGLQTYGPGETPVADGPGGYVKIERDPEEVFRPETILSFEGKPLVNDHPDEDVGPLNYKALTCGVVLNVRRGDGIEDDLLLADLLVMDAETIAAVEDGKVEVSCGYDSQYREIAPGHAAQYDIIGNHVALVDNGRCGPRCAIQDHAKRVKVHDSACCGACLSTAAQEAAKAAATDRETEFSVAAAARRRRPVHIHLHL